MSPDYDLGQSLHLHCDLMEETLLQHFLAVEVTVPRHFVRRIGSHFENSEAETTKRKDHLAAAEFAVVLGSVVVQVEGRVEGDGLRSVPVDVHPALPMWTERSWRFGVKDYLTVMEIHFQQISALNSTCKICLAKGERNSSFKNIIALTTYLEEWLAESFQSIEQNLPSEHCLVAG
jgi:hypothetical protein